ncbi:hypothetical protein LTR05_002336 [Lithohypha guttulata]|uniref:Uncharacterized protein n=1 Tax=Lithohypha guttulata TaxID=1690604 RepID=A0AAN7T386_9EURO|nr:hypothetical protein LTR05_002336 [Lithohypha guttulata]
MARKYTNELRDSIDLQLQYSNRVLSQFEFAGVPLYTNNFARIACTNYKPSTAGERYFNHSLTNLPVFVAVDDRLQFGFNEKHVWRNAGLHLYEYEHILLASALGECLPEAYVASILSCLGRMYEDKDRVNPSFSSWQNFVRSVNGLISTLDFARMIDDRMQLDPYRVTSGHSTSCGNSLVPPDDFAKALKALGNLSLAGKGQLTLVGGNFLGWFAAFSELFLGIDVQVSSRDGQNLYATHFNSGATLHLIFIDNVEDLNSTLKMQESVALRLICPADGEAQSLPKLPFTGRVIWEAFLPKVFENSFHKIAHQESKILVKSIGGVARLFELLINDPSTPSDMISKENRANPASFGMGLIQTLCNWFPELRHLQGRLERIQTLSSSEVMQKCNDGAQGLVQLCGCTLCHHPFYSDNDTGTLPQSFCLLALMETIVNLGLALSRMTVVTKLYPSRAGMLCFYQRQCKKLLSAKTATIGRQEPYSRIKLLFMNDWNVNDSRRLQDAAALFSGSWPQGDLPDNLIALGHEGLCVYVISAQRGNRKEDAGLIRVQPGNLSWDQKTFTRASLGFPQGDPQNDYSWEVGHPKHLSQELYFK